MEGVEALSSFSRQKCGKDQDVPFFLECDTHLLCQQFEHIHIISAHQRDLEILDLLLIQKTDDALSA